jgi:hypothetical protein
MRADKWRGPHSVAFVRGNQSFVSIFGAELDFEDLTFLEDYRSFKAANTTGHARRS